MQASGPNAEQIVYWNEQAGPRWVAAQEPLDEHIAPLGRLALERGAIRAGERALDVGCGCGHSTLELARRVGPSGSALGIDVSTVMLARARARADAVDARNVDFLEADAQTHALEASSFDLLYSRFGVMFFADPPAAFANLRRALRPDGRLAFVCWQALAKNPWMVVPLTAAAKHIELPPPPSPDAPGPMSLADPERVRRILGAAGFADVVLEPVEAELTVGGPGLDTAVEFLLAVGPTARAVQQVGGEKRETVARAVREAITPYVTPEGVRMRGAVWIVRARGGA